MKTLSVFAFVALIFCGCSRNYDVDIPFQAADASGTWVLESAPPAVLRIFGTNNLSSSTLTFQKDGTATFKSFPLQQTLDLGAIESHPSQWVILSDTNMWSLEDDGDKGWHMWNIRLQTGKMGIQLLVGKRNSGDLILVYCPAPDSGESVIYKRKGAE